MRQQQRVLDSMTRIRELILRQQQALAEQRIFDQRAFKAAPSEADEDAREYMDKGEGGGGFAGAEAKKRRGRAAPPGRCHSCNRAETPEWRRGPDGARTLCNACGLRKCCKSSIAFNLLTYPFRLRQASEKDGFERLWCWTVEVATKRINRQLTLNRSDHEQW